MNLLDIAGAALHWNLPPTNSPKFSVDSLDWAKILREAWLWLLPWLATKAVLLIPGLENFHYEFGGKDYTWYVIFGLRLLLEAAKRYLQGHPLPAPATPPKS